MDLMIEDLMEQLVQGGGSDLHLATALHQLFHQVFDHQILSLIHI